MFKYRASRAMKGEDGTSSMDPSLTFINRASFSSYHDNKKVVFLKILSTINDCKSKLKCYGNHEILVHNGGYSKLKIDGIFDKLVSNDGNYDIHRHGSFEKLDNSERKA